MLYKVAGFARWVKCRAVKKRRVPRAVALAQLRVCTGCEMARCRRVLGMLVLSCGPLGVDRTGEAKPTCGCVVGYVGKKRAAGLGGAAKDEILAAMGPAGKSMCRAACDQGKWEGIEKATHV